jgi:hypothetical protein
MIRVLLFLLLLASPALAQGRFFVEVLGGDIRLDLTNQAAFGMNLNINAGVKELAGPFGLGGGFGLGVQQGQANFNLGVGANFSLGRPPIDPEVGLGFNASFGGSAPEFRIQAFGGAEFSFNRNVSLLAGLVPVVIFAGGGTSFGFGIQAGLRVYP